MFIVTYVEAYNNLVSLSIGALYADRCSEQEQERLRKEIEFYLPFVPPHEHPPILSHSPLFRKKPTKPKKLTKPKKPTKPKKRTFLKKKEVTNSL
jgi:hypothetical protein